MEYEPRKCRICGKEFTPKNRVQVYCGYECQRVSNRENAKRLMREYTARKREARAKTARCLVCGKEFVKKSGKQMYCGSAECNRERMRRYQRERRTPATIRPPKILKKTATISEIAAAARAMDLSYGDYVARYMS